MSIGEFARLSRLSAKALRLYDELGLLPPAQVDRDSGYRWYAAGQLDNARLVASLRQIGVPLAQIQLILSLEPEAAAAQVGAYWSGAEADHAARRDLAGYLVDRLAGKRNVMYEVKVRDIPARSLLCLLRHASIQQEVWDLGKEVIGMLKAKPPPRVDGVAGAAFLIYYGEVNQDSDGPVEFCWPVSQDLAGQLAASFPGLTLRTEPRLTPSNRSRRPPVPPLSGRWGPRRARAPCWQRIRPRRIFIARRSTASDAPAWASRSPAAACSTVNGCAAIDAGVRPAISFAPDTRSSSQPAPGRLPNGPGPSSARLASAHPNAPRRPEML
ncbi:MAG TPA: helix-turn-helix domain-containing protein [Streptosporangiaceae bacterium]|nr:helix-turn-helix domain-containing protein [Streptosporangiaceae bacterium]